MPNPLLIPAIISAGASLFGASQASKNQKQANKLQREALDTARSQYNSRGGFRDAARAALMRSTPDAMQWYDASLYENEALPETGYGNQLRTAAQRIAEVDRLGLAKEALADFDAESAPLLEQQYRRVGQRAATLGRIGAGGVTTELGELTARAQREREIEKNRLIRDASVGAVEDQYRALNAIGGMDDRAYGRLATERERRTQLGRQGLADRLMLQGENRASRDAVLREVLGLGGLGYSNDPSSALLAGAQMFQGQSNQAGANAAQAASYLGNLLAQMQQRGGGGGYQATGNEFNNSWGY